MRNIRKARRQHGISFISLFNRREDLDSSRLSDHNIAV